MAARTTVNGGKSDLKYGQWHPQFAFPVESYSHKLALMKRYGLEEASDAVGGNRKHSEEDHHDASQPDPGEVDAGWGDPDVIEELKKAQYEQAPVRLGGKA